MIDFVSTMNDRDVKIPAKLKKALNQFFNKTQTAAEGCIIRDGKSHGYPHAKIVLIIESSDLYHYLQGEFGWEIHTRFYEMVSEKTTGGYQPEMINSCEIGFYN